MPHPTRLPDHLVGILPGVPMRPSLLLSPSGTARDGWVELAGAEVPAVDDADDGDREATDRREPPEPGSLAMSGVVADAIRAGIAESGLAVDAFCERLSGLAGRRVTPAHLDRWTAAGERRQWNFPLDLAPAFDAACGVPVFGAMLAGLHGGRTFTREEAGAAEHARLRCLGAQMAAQAAYLRVLGGLADGSLTPDAYFADVDDDEPGDGPDDRPHDGPVGDGPGDGAACGFIATLAGARTGPPALAPLA